MVAHHLVAGMTREPLATALIMLFAIIGAVRSGFDAGWWLGATLHANGWLP